MEYLNNGCFNLGSCAWYRLGRASRKKIVLLSPRIEKALLHIDSNLQDPRLSTKSLASIVVKIISMSPVLGNISRIMTTGHCQMSVAAAQDWDSVVPLDS